jgi:signal transduction histidine kinase/ActR/RegA family two-component response regulator
LVFLDNQISLNKDHRIHPQDIYEKALAKYVFANQFRFLCDTKSGLQIRSYYRHNGHHISKTIKGDMNTAININPEKLLARIEYLENHRRFIQSMLEMALSLGDFQENINKGHGPKCIFQEAEKRINHLIPLDATVFYLVDQDHADFKLALCNEPTLKEFVENEVEHMIDKGLFAWAIREKKGVSISSRDHTRKFILHVIATYSRIRGIFVGLLPSEGQKIPDTSLTLLSIILLNTANAVESLEFYSLLRSQNIILEKKVEEHTKALAQSERQLQQVLKIQAIGTLAGGIAHDFNNILFPIVGFTELTMDEVPEDSSAHKNLEEILKSANRAKDLVQQILTFSRQSGHERKPIKIQYIIKEALKLLRASIPATIEIVHELDENYGAISGDAIQIHQIIMNLCTNAYQAMQETGGKLEVRLAEVDINYVEAIEITGLTPGRYLQLTVKDEGCGMEPAILDRIFEPYYTTKAPGQGAGLGLSVIHGMVKNHGGDITVSSTPGKGSAFHVFLPLIDEIDEETKTNSFSEAAGGNEHILLVDDEEQIVALMQQMLENLGYRVTARTDGQEALKVFAQHPEEFDLVITDMTMPHITGDRLAQKLIGIKPDIPIILCTGFNETITEEKALSRGIQKFIMKPVVKSELASAIRAVLEGA